MVRVVITLEQILAKTPSDAAAFWLVRQDLGESAEDDLVFQQWLEADPLHGSAWARACSLWEGAAELSADDAAILREPAPSRGWRDWRIAAAASIFAVTIGCGALYWGLGSYGQRDAQIAARSEPGSSIQTFATVAGDRRVVVLGDKSVVTLNTDTALSVQIGSSQRRVTLERGQAFFDVAHDAARPFIVERNGLTITAIGTRFDVRGNGDSTRVALVEGRLRVVVPVGGTSQTVDLQPGQQLVADRTRVSLAKADVTGVTDWQNGLASFRDTPLSQAALELNRYAAGKQLLIRDPKVAAIRISGSFHTNDLRRFARTLAEIYPVQVVESASTIELVSRGHVRH